MIFHVLGINNSPESHSLQEERWIPRLPRMYSSLQRYHQHVFKYGANGNIAVIPEVKVS